MSPQAHSQDAILVTPTLVRVQIPIGRGTNEPWQWNDAATPDMQAEYRWSAVLDGDTTHSIGFMLYKRRGAAPRSGSFDELLRAGQAELALVTGHTARVVRGVRPILLGADSLLIVELRDSTVIAAVFARRPTQAFIETLVPYQPFTRRRVPIRYDGF